MVEKVVVKEIVKEVPVEKIVTIYDKSDDSELLSKIQHLENGMSKKQEELAEVRRTLDELLTKPPVEKIVEVVVEKEITDNSSKVKLDAIQTTLAKVRQETLEKDEKIKELENTIQELENTIQELKKTQENRQAVYLKGSNLNNKL